jgi:toxin ParE1/3/4
MPKYRLTNKAVDDLSNIWDYTFDTWSEIQADSYYRHLIGNFELLAENPGIGRKYDEFIHKLMGLKVGRHIIFYQILSPSEIEVIRILHGRMDLKNRLLE